MPHEDQSNEEILEPVDGPNIPEESNNTSNSFEWQDGDLITAERLNAMRPPLAIHIVKSTLDKTCREIYQTMAAGIPVYVFEEDGDVLGGTDGGIYIDIIASVVVDEGSISVDTNIFGSFYADSLDEYPTKTLD